MAMHGTAGGHGAVGGEVTGGWARQHLKSREKRNEKARECLIFFLFLWIGYIHIDYLIEHLYKVYGLLFLPTMDAIRCVKGDRNTSYLYAFRFEDTKPSKGDNIG